MTYQEQFEKRFPKAIDFLELEYLKARTEIDEAAVAAGYRFAGWRLGRAVFSTKPPRPTP